MEVKVKNKEFLICVDSDGCIMDGMTIKHIKCFYPCIAEVWNLPVKSDAYLNIWSKINLFSQNRGINRFKGLEIFFKKLIEMDAINEEISKFSEWCTNTKVLSNSSLYEEIKKTDDDFLKKALHWSKRVNEEIEKMPEGSIVPFDFTNTALAKAAQNADIAIVSSANREAVNSEWEKHNLLQSVKYIMTQEDGTKAECIKTLLNYGYKKESSLMIGDAPGDMQAALKNDILFYPIIAGKEEKSWEDFVYKILKSIFESRYRKEYMDTFINSFNENLEG